MAAAGAAWQGARGKDACSQVAGNREWNGLDGVRALQAFTGNAEP